MLETGKNTYATVEFANQYIEAHYMPFNPLRVHFSVLTDDEKEAYLRSSLQEIEKLHFSGRKRIVNQTLSFPRKRQTSYACYSPTYLSVFTGVDETQIPECVRQAQVENALGIISNEISAVSDKQFMTLQSLGIIKNTKYNKREAGDLGFGADITGGTSINRCPLSSQKAYSLLREWLGGIAIC